MDSLKSTFDLDGLMQRLDESARAQGFKDHQDRYEQEEKADAARTEAEAAAVNQAHRRARCAKLSGRLPDAMLAAIAENDSKLGDTQAWKSVQRWLVSQKPVLVLCGGVGAGKTVAAVRALADFRGSTQFVRAIRIGAHYERWSSDRDDGVDPLRMDCGLLVIDDLGQEQHEDRRSLSALEEIADSRQSIRTRTLFTSNLELEAIRARYPERMLSRWAQIAAFSQVHVEHDMRRSRGER